MAGDSTAWEKGEKTAKPFGPEWTPENHIQGFCHPFHEKLEH
jgi:hypothetical protein